MCVCVCVCVCVCLCVRFNKRLVIAFAILAVMNIWRLLRGKKLRQEIKVSRVPAAVLAELGLRPEEDEETEQSMAEISQEIDEGSSSGRMGVNDDQEEERGSL